MCGLAGQADYVLSPPAISSETRQATEIHTDLRELEDLYGLALLLEDDQAAQALKRILAVWQVHYRPLLNSDPVLKKIDDRTQDLFAQLLADRSRPPGDFARMVRSYPHEKLRPTMVPWLRDLFFRRGVFFHQDLDRLDADDLQDLCLQARCMETLRDLPVSRYRILAWRYRDNQVRRLFSQRDDRAAFLSPIHIHVGTLDPSLGDILHRYLARLRNLKLQIIQDRTMPYDRFRTLSGLMRGLRYMDTIQRATQLTGLDHRLMTNLFVQESEFIHHRVSPAGAFSLAQFLNIALKDVWLFRDKIPGSRLLLRGVDDLADLKKRVIADPRMAIRASCLYFRRLRDEVVLRLGNRAKMANRQLINLLTVEMMALRQGVLAQANHESMIGLSQRWPLKDVLLPLIPLPGFVLPSVDTLVTDWVERTVRELAQVQIAEGVFRQRLDLLHSALGLSAYNAGMSNLLKASRQRASFSALSFPLQITETRNYVDDILDGTHILGRVDRFSSEIARLGYQGLMNLAKRACRKVSGAKGRD